MVSQASALRHLLSDAAAARAVDGAVAEAQAMGVPVTITVVDDGGNLKAMRRMDRAPLVSVQTAQNKAYAAAAIGMPVDDFFEAIKQDAAAVASFASRPGLALIAGGVPLLADGAVIGGLGVAGAMTAADDRRIAEAGARQASS
jgi:glc operon protein GlcG